MTGGRVAYVHLPDTSGGGFRNFNRYFYKPKAMRTLEEIRAELLSIEKEAESLIDEILGGLACESNA